MSNAAAEIEPAETILEVNNIEVIYDHVILVLKGVSLTVPRGGIVAILGAIIAGVLYFLSADRLVDKEEKIVQMQAELQLLLDKNESADLEIAELQEILTGQTKLVEEADVRMEEDRAKLVVEMQESQRTQKKLIEAQKKITQLEETTTRLREELVNAENLFAAASQESLIAQLKERISELATSNAQLRNEMKTSAKQTNQFLKLMDRIFYKNLQNFL